MTGIRSLSMYGALALFALGFASLGGCGASDSGAGGSAEGKFIAAIRDGAPDNTEDDLTLIDNAAGICDQLAAAETAAERAHLIIVWDGDNPAQREFDRVYFDAATRYLCPDVHDDYLQAVDLADDGYLDNGGDATAADPTPSSSITYDDLVLYAVPPTQAQLDYMTGYRDDCINGDDTACNTLWWQAIAHDTEASFIPIAATCGGRAPEHRPGDGDDVSSWEPC